MFAEFWTDLHFGIDRVADHIIAHIRWISRYIGQELCWLIREDGLPAKLFSLPLVDVHDFHLAVSDTQSSMSRS